MRLDEYQEFTKRLASYNTEVFLYTGRNVIPGLEKIEKMEYMYPALALAEEAGETVGKIAKYIRKSRDETDNDKLRLDIGKELGDVLYQVSETARQFGFRLEEIATMNMAKLNDRVARNVLIGEGDDR